MKDWFMALETNERRMLLGGGTLLLVMLLYVGIWEPLSNKVATLRASTAEQTALLAWMRSAAQEVKQLRGRAGSTAIPASGGSLLSLVDRTARSGRLGGALKRVQPDGDQKVRVWLEAASFDDLVRWLATLETRHGVHVESSVFQALEAPGKVDARLVFTAGG
ncbi:MAG TPA: type II secretion system protein M [Gammaproteobacteria bacterium]|nr:type II secretion system protein M [Gammaproteobacteria bacterium]